MSKTMKKTAENIKDNQAKGAQRAMLEELFNDLYTDRKKVYKMNFFRGIFLGFGTALGGTIVVALLLWLLSLFVDFPFIGDYFQQAKETIDQR